MDSIWKKSCTIAPRESLKQDIKTDVAIIGAGMAGVLTAYKLKKCGIDCVVLEANRIASGQTQNTTAKITQQHGHIYDRLIKDLEHEKAQQYATANIRAVEEYKKIIELGLIDCDFEIKDAYLYSTSDEQALHDEVNAAKSLGLPASFATNLNLPFNVLGAVKFENQAQFNPLKFINSISSDLTIYENTIVKKVEDNIITTGQGNTVTASKIVFACHYPFINVPGYYFMRMHQERVYFIALENAPQVNGMFIGMNSAGYSLRNYKNLLIFGGESHRTGENISGGKYDAVRTAAKRFYPSATEVAHWSAQDCISTDGIPYIGKFSKEKPNWYVATGFMKWGMSTSMVAATIISDMICDKDNDCAKVFSPQRFAIADIPQTFHDGIKATKGIAKEKLSITQKTIDDLTTDSADVVEVDGEPMGVYKDKDNNVFVIRARCSHLGCRLEWNKDEKSWDCPCHGSRYDYKGNLLDGPAQEDIKDD
ncbi:MAG: FAD-dependent oxidoreductase [Clostridia bacterium]|nr:FAD-dependent oxidoreductase [Clostridia bacterium]